MASKANPVSTLTVKRSLPKSFVKAAGMLRHHKKALEQHLKKVRNEWDRK